MNTCEGLIAAGYSITHSNSEEAPCWLIMRWGTIEHYCYGSLLEAAQWLKEKLDARSEADVRAR
jgi:hypothetical protein